MPVKVETDTHIYEGQVILAPAGVEKTTNFGTEFKEVILDYPSQTRDYLNYSDFTDPRLTAFFFKDTPREPVKYMRNTIMFLEDEIHRLTTKNEDRHYDRIIPYMVSVDPTLQFADSRQNLPLPEFFEEYPIFVSPEKYDAIKDEYYTIYKVFDENTDFIHLIPQDSVHTLAAEVVSFDAYLTDSDGNQIPLGTYPGDYSFIFDKDKGTVILSSAEEEFFKKKINDVEEESEYTVDAYIVLEFKVEKFRKITDLNYLTSDDVYGIATMQSVHASILEYMYQFTIAQKTQERLNEIAYTSFITIASTLITLGVSYAYKGITGSISGGLGFNLFKVGTAVFSETMEELYIDPWIEAYVSNKVADIGGSAFEQIFWSSMAESARETGISQVTQILGTHSQAQISQDLHSTAQETMTEIQQVKDEIIAQKEQASQGAEVITTAVSSILLFAGALTGGLFGSSIGSTLANVLIVAGTEVTLVDDIFDVVLDKQAEAQLNKKVIEIYTKDPKSFTIPDSAKSLPTDEAFRFIKETTDIEGYMDEYGVFHIYDWSHNPVPTFGQCCGATVGPIRSQKFRLLNKLLIKSLMYAHMDLLINDLLKSQIRDVLVDNNIITSREKAGASKTELIKMIIDNDRINHNTNLYDQLKLKVSEGAHRGIIKHV